LLISFDISSTRLVTVFLESEIPSALVFKFLSLQFLEKIDKASLIISPSEKGFLFLAKSKDIS